MKKLAKIAVGACAASMALTMAGCATSEQPPSESSEMTSPDYDPSENLPVALYGPPEMLDGSPTFDPSSNQNEDVYGPPDMLEPTEETDGSSNGTDTAADSTGTANAQ